MPDVRVMEQGVVFRQGSFEMLAGFLGFVEDADESAGTVRMRQRLRVGAPAFARFPPSL